MDSCVFPRVYCDIGVIFLYNRKESRRLIRRTRERKRGTIVFFKVAGKDILTAK